MKSIHDNNPMVIRPIDINFFFKERVNPNMKILLLLTHQNGLNHQKLHKFSFLVKLILMPLTALYCVIHKSKKQNNYLPFQIVGFLFFEKSVITCSPKWLKPTKCHYNIFIFS